MTDDTPNTQKYSAEMYDLLCRLSSIAAFSAPEMFEHDVRNIIVDEIDPLLNRMQNDKEGA